MEKKSATTNRSGDTIAVPLDVVSRDSLLPFRDGEDGKWDRGLAAHLARRSGFGMPPAVVDRFAERGPAASVKELFTEIGDEPAAVKLLETAMSINSLESAQSWWIHQMLHGASALREKIALFWHGHFATSDEKVDNPRLMMDQLNLFRTRGLGPFGELVQRVAKDPAMLLWLDGNLNRAGKPNENWARELMELFTLGEGNYTEQDIKQAARAFTGWHMRGTSFWFNRRAYDTGEKRLLGHSGVKTGEEVVDICVRHAASAKFIAKKLFVYFVHPRPGEKLVDMLAGLYEECDRDIGRYLRKLFSSRLFFSPEVRRSIISAPVDYAIGTLRTLGARAAPSRIAGRLKDMGQELFRPPNVKGWDGGRTWINSTSLLARLKFCLDLVEGEPLGARVPWEALAGDGSVLDGVVDRCFPGGFDPELREALGSAAGSSDPKRILASVMQIPEYQMI